MAAPSITNAPPLSVLKKLRTGAARLRAHAVRPPNGIASVTLIGVYSTSGGSRRFELIWRESASEAARRANRRCSSSSRSINAFR